MMLDTDLLLMLPEANLSSNKSIEMGRPSQFSTLCFAVFFFFLLLVFCFNFPIVIYNEFLLCSYLLFFLRCVLLM